MTRSKLLTLVVALLAAIAIAGSAEAQQDSKPDSGPSQNGSMMDQQPGGHMMGGGMGQGGPMMGGGMGQGGPMMGHHGMRRGMGGGFGSMCGRMTAHIEGRLAFLKAELKITPQQESAWNSYAAAVRDNAKAIGDRCAAMMKPGGSEQSLPDRLDAQEQFVASRLDALRAVSKALKPLYGALDEQQKQLADQLIRSSTGMM